MNLLKQHSLPLLTAAIGVLLLFQGLIGTNLETTLWADNYDSKLIYWIVSWGYHALVELKQPWEFWQANSFFPHSHALAFSDGLLGLQPFFIPLRLIGLSKLAALYCSLGLVCIVAAFFTDRALIRIGGFSALERIIIIYAAHFGMPMVNFLIHYQLFGVQLAIPFLLFTHLYLQRWQRSDLIYAAALFTWGTLIATYLAPMLTVYALILAIGQAVQLLRHKELKIKVQQQLLTLATVLIPTAIVLYFLQFHAYFAIFNSKPEGWLVEASTYAAHPLSLFTGFSQSSLLYRFKSGDPWFGAGERAYFPGIVLLAMSFIAFIFWRRADKNLREIGLFALIVLVTGIVMSWGPLYRFESSIKLPFFYLAEIVPGLCSVRTPGRFGMILGLPLSLLTVIALRGLRPVRYTFWSTAILILVTFESLPIFKSHTLVISPIYQRVAQYISPDSALIELPVADSNKLRETSTVVNQLVGSTQHWGRLVVGYGARQTDEMKELLRLDAELRADKPVIQDLINFARRIRVENLLIHLERYPKITRVRWRKIIKSSRSLSLVEQIDNSYLVKLY